MKPSVGRVVLYYQNRTAAPQVALIAAVWSPTCINIVLFKTNGNPVIDPPTSVSLIAPGAEHPEHGFFCAWMPYQADQAALNDIATLKIAVKAHLEKIECLESHVSSLHAENEELRKLLPDPVSSEDPSQPASGVPSADLNTD